MHDPRPGGPTTTASSTLRACLDQAFPNGVAWLEAVGLDHPAAVRADRIAFWFAIGRLEQAGRGRTVRELRLVADDLLADSTLEALPGRIVAYARWCAETGPTLHARLTGRALAGFRRAEART